MNSIPDAIASLLADLPDRSDEETIETIVESETCRIERIVSQGHSTPSGEWYDQDRNEWVMILRGSAGLQFLGKGDIVVMKTGDHITIPAHSKHRVAWTDPDSRTIWIAVHY